MTVHLTVEKSAVVAFYFDGSRRRWPRVVRSEAGILRYLSFVSKRLGGVHISSVLCSSSLDFPDEYTSDKKVIALCNEIRK